MFVVVLRGRASLATADMGNYVLVMDVVVLAQRVDARAAHKPIWWLASKQTRGWRIEFYLSCVVQLSGGCVYFESLGHCKTLPVRQEAMEESVLCCHFIGMTKRSITSKWGKLRDDTKKLPKTGMTLNHTVDLTLSKSVNNIVTSVKQTNGTWNINYLLSQILKFSKVFASW